MMLLKIYEDEHPILKKIEWLPCSIGRSMHNDIRLGHASVSGQHAIIETWEDHFILRDLGSSNGLFHGGLKISEVALKDNEIVWLGDVKIEIVLKESLQKTGPGQALGLVSQNAGWMDIIAALAILWGGYAAALALVFFDAYEKQWPPERLFPLFMRAFLFWGAGAVGTTVFALFSKVNVKKFYFRNIAGLIFGFGFIARILSRSIDTIVFNLQNIPGLQYLDSALLAILAFVFVKSLTRLILSNVTNRIRWIVAAALALSTVFLMRWMAIDESSESGKTVMTRLGVPLLDHAIGIDSDSEDLRVFFFRTIAEVDGDRARTMAREDELKNRTYRGSNERIPEGPDHD